MVIIGRVVVVVVVVTGNVVAVPGGAGANLKSKLRDFHTSIKDFYL